VKLINKRSILPRRRDGSFVSATDLDDMEEGSPRSVATVVVNQNKIENENRNGIKRNTKVFKYNDYSI
jgi:hypothetical protein